MAACACDSHGTKQCIETPGQEPVCECHDHYAGHDCSACAKGYIHDDETGYCVKNSKCAERGGDIDCNGFGQCIQKGEHAYCVCDPGFRHDGLFFCGQCVDPMMEWPMECDETRKWILSSDEQECASMPSHMPTNLYHDKNKNEKTRREMFAIHQQDSGLLEWSGLYNLKHEPHDSKHYFIIPATSKYRLFINTEDSGVEISYRIYDPDGKLVEGSEDHFSSIVEYGTIHRYDGKKDSEVFTLELNYRKLNTSEYEDFLMEDIAGAGCPHMQIHFNLEPIEFA